MNTIITVFIKELIDTLRDKRTLMTAIVMPALAIPVLMYGVTVVTKMIVDKEKNKKLKVALLEAPQEFIASLDTAKIELKTGYTIESGGRAIRADSLDALIGFDNDFITEQTDMKTSKVNLWYKMTNLSVQQRMTKYIDDYEDGLLKGRIAQLGLTEKSITPIDLKAWDIAEAKETLGKTVGGFLPYMFIVFCFMGCMYPALDLITGEKERGTIETLLTVPASRFKILLGKVLTISLVGLASAIMGIVGLYIGAKLLPDLPPEMQGVLNNIVSLKFVLMLLIMLLPLCVFFAGLLSAMVVRAKSFKEAQSIVSPFSMVVILPAALAMLPGIELDWKTAMIPILNIALATKEIIADTINIGQYGLIVGSLIALAILGVVLSYRQFSKEGMVLK